MSDDEVHAAAVRAVRGDTSMTRLNARLNEASDSSPTRSATRIALPSRLLMYGLGMSLRALIADPSSAAGAVEIGARS